MLPDILSALLCPPCRLPLAEAAGALACGNGHSFDIARQGYVNLLSGRAHTGTADTPAMVAARQAFLERGHYAPVAAALAESVTRAIAGVPGIVLDVGGGTGYYLAAVLEDVPDRVGLALDISKHAARYAARAHPCADAAVCDAWGPLPVADGAAAAVLSVFAPRNAPEFSRVLGPGGALVTVTPTTHHLEELVSVLGLLTVDERKDERLAGALAEDFVRERADAVERQLRLTHAEVAQVAGMGPSAHHASEAEFRARIGALPEQVPTTLSVTVTTWRSR